MNLSLNWCLLAAATQRHWSNESHVLQLAWIPQCVAIILYNCTSFRQQQYSHTRRPVRLRAAHQNVLLVQINCFTAVNNCSMYYIIISGMHH